MRTSRADKLLLDFGGLNKPCAKQGLAVIQFYEGVAANNMPNIVELRYRGQGVE